MNTLRAALVGVLTLLLATTAFAQAPAPSTGGEISTLGGRAVGVGPGGVARYPTPLFMLGPLAVGIWTRVPAPYDVSANRNAAANPLP